jgi:hypothetical protein
MAPELREHRLNGLLREHILPGEAVLVVLCHGDRPPIIVAIREHVTLCVIHVVFITLRLKRQTTAGLLEKRALVEPRRLVPHQSLFTAAEVIKELGVIHRRRRAVHPVSLITTEFVTAMVEARQRRVGVQDGGHAVVVIRRDPGRVSPAAIRQLIAHK